MVRPTHSPSQIRDQGIKSRQRRTALMNTPLPFLPLLSPRFASGPNSTVGILTTDVVPGDGEVGAGVGT